jgi:hypothetical protein
MSTLAEIERSVFQLTMLRRATHLLARYANVFMNFADATLVVLAENLDTPNTLTLDERGFRTFRYRRNKRFRLMLAVTPEGIRTRSASWSSGQLGRRDAESTLSVTRPTERSEVGPSS